jgi:two-component system response regulator MtrA
MGQRILLIEDDAALGTQIVGHLRGAGFETRWLTNGASFHKSEDCDFDLLVLDLMLPGVPGLEILKRFRQRSDVPVLVLSARNDGETRVRGLQLGADDYLAKPFWPEELVERVRARLRRPTLQRATAIEVGPLRVDLHTREVTVGDESVALTGTEYAILAALARRRGAPVTRQSLGELLDADNENPDRTVDVHVSRLRKKLGEAGASIVTVWGIGYRLGGGPTP